MSGDRLLWRLPPKGRARRPRHPKSVIPLSAPAPWPFGLALAERQDSGEYGPCFLTPKGRSAMPVPEALRTLIRANLADGRIPRVQFHVQCFYVWDTERNAPKR